MAQYPYIYRIPEGQLKGVAIHRGHYSNKYLLDAANVGVDKGIATTGSGDDFSIWNWDDISKEWKANEDNLSEEDFYRDENGVIRIRIADQVINVGNLSVETDTSANLTGAEWILNGFERNFSGELTLLSNDPDNDRIDIIVAKEDGTVEVITGIASSDAQFPPTPEGTLLLHTILRSAVTGSIVISKPVGNYGTRFKAGPLGEYALIWETDISLNQSYIFQLWYLGFVSDYANERTLNGVLKVAFLTSNLEKEIDVDKSIVVSVDENGDDGDFVLQDTGNGKAQIYVRKTAWNQSTIYNYIGSFSTVNRNMLRDDQVYGNLPTVDRFVLSSAIKGSGAESFTDLSDAPNTLIGQAFSQLQVSSDETSLAFFNPTIVNYRSTVTLNSNNAGTTLNASTVPAVRVTGPGDNCFIRGKEAVANLRFLIVNQKEVPLNLNHNNTDIDEENRFHFDNGKDLILPPGGWADILYVNDRWRIQTVSHPANIYDTFIPEINGSTSNPTLSYTDQFGDYALIDRLCHFEIRLNWQSISGGTGNIRIPLPVARHSNTANGGPAIAVMTGLSTTPPIYACYSGFNNITFRNEAGNEISVSDLESEGVIALSGTYITA